MVTGDDDTVAVGWAVRVAEQCFADLAYEDAADWYGRALGLVTALDREGELLIRRGEASVLAAGDTAEARETFRQAAVVAANAATPNSSHAPRWAGSGRGGFEVPRNHAVQISLLEEAARALGPPSRTGAPAAVLARLGVASSLAAGPGRDVRRSPRRPSPRPPCRRPSTLGYALAVHCDVIAGPDWSAARPTRRARSSRWPANRRPELELLGHRLRLVARLELGDVAGADQDVAGFATVAGQLAQALHLWPVRCGGGCGR